MDAPMNTKLSLLDRGDEVSRTRGAQARVLTGVLAGGLSALAAYLRVYRPWHLRWGATDQEVQLPMPGDNIVPRPTFNATRAVTITARPQEIWPWLVQIGAGRGGWYTYDWLDSLGRHSAERIIPEFQHLAVGDLIPISPDGKQGQWVKAFEPNRWMLWGDKAGDVSWYWGLYPLDEGHTRLITRVHMRYRWTSPVILFNLLVEFADVVMMRKCLLGIKRRAEMLAADRPGEAMMGRPDTPNGATTSLGRRHQR
jgi:hypothetical protein